MAADFGVPQWAFGLSTYGFDAHGRIVCSYVQDGVSRLAVLDADSQTDVNAVANTGTREDAVTGTSVGGGAPAGTTPPNSRFRVLALPFCAISELQVGADFAVFIGGSATAPEAIVRLDLDRGTHRVLRSASPITLEPGFVASAEAIGFPTEAGRTAHAFFYRPVNRNFSGPPNQRAPLIVISHGGPTGATTPAFKWSIQYWTSRGFAVVDVNYGGSSGHGRAYRERLNGRWGVVDVDDCVNAARFLIERDDVDPARLAIRGSSAGGYTTLCALTFRRFFGCGVSLYGVGDLEALALDTHKFESRYLDRLVGPYPAQRALYIERSPVHHTESLSSPMILLQGAEDRVVPPEQARAMFEAVRAKGLPVAYLL
ncbi:MAG: prolyl oligopeptidase family serine peptidase, partial [Burkholderiaceae bacterium]